MSQTNQTSATRLSSEEIGIRGSQSTYLWCESTIEDGQILLHRVGLDTACAYAQSDARDAHMFADRETLNRIPPHDGTSCGMTTVQAMKRRIDFRITAEDDLEPWAVY